MPTINQIIETGIPPNRNLLKSEIYRCGYDTFGEFAQSIEITQPYLSNILRGHCFPSNKLQTRMAKALGLSLRQLRELL